MRKSVWSMALAGWIAGTVTGLFGGGGGMVLIPLLTLLSDLEENQIFSASLAVILPVCLVCLFFAAREGPLPWMDAFPYLVGSFFGGIAAGLWGQKIPVLWLHRGLGVLILWGGWRYLWAI